MKINGIQCCTLGHDFKGPVIEHPYFGTECVINDLRKMPGWNSGLILLNETCMIRNEKTNFSYWRWWLYYEARKPKIRSLFTFSF